MHEITYVFKKGRKDNYFNKTIEAKEFYYGLPLFDEDIDIKVIEFDNSEQNTKKIISKIDRVFSKLFSLPFYFSKILSKKNFKILKNSKNIILTNESVACSLLPFLIYIKIFTKNNILIFAMGLYSKELNYKNLKFFHYLLIKLVVYTSNKVFFLGKGELNLAKSIYKNSDKFVYFPFSIDTKFWNYEDIDNLNKYDILFVGNDSNRNTEILKQLPKHLPNLKFKYITNIKDLHKLNIKNVDVIKGEWGKGYLSDYELLKHYANSKICIIPLYEGSQPSGQSVSFQAMSVGIPVIISNTQGFWDHDEFIDYHNISFVYENNLNNWIKKINELIDDSKLLKIISENAKKTISEKFNLEIFFKKLSFYLK